MSMLNYVQAIRNRIWLRINEHGSFFFIKTQSHLAWEPIDERLFVSSSAAVKGHAGGEKVLVSSMENVNQTIFIADIATNRAVGSIEILDNGAVRTGTGYQLEMSREDLGRDWRNKCTLILGVPNPCSINFKDILGKDTDIFRLKPEYKVWFIPKMYAKATSAYDVYEDAKASPSGSIASLHQQAIGPYLDAQSQSVERHSDEESIVSVADSHINRKVENEELDKPSSNVEAEP